MLRNNKTIDDIKFKKLFFLVNIKFYNFCPYVKFKYSNSNTYPKEIVNLSN